MVNHIHVHRANVQPLFDYPVLAGQPTTPSQSPNPNTGTATAPGPATPTAASATAKTDSGPGASSTGNTSAAGNSATPTTADASSSTDGGLLGGLLSTHVSLGPSGSTTSTASSTSAVTAPTSAAAAGQASSGTAVQSGSASVSTIFQTLGPSSSSSPAPPPSANNPDAGPIAGGVIGGLFAIAALAMLVSFLLRRRRRKQIDKEILGTDIFGGSGYRRSTIFLEDAAKGGDRTDSDKLIPRPPSMIERRVGTPAIHGDPVEAPYGYAPQAPGYPPQSMQRGYYSQGQQQPPYFQQPGYNPAFAYGGPQVPSRAHTPQVPGHHHPHQMLSGPPPTHELPNPFGARNNADHIDAGLAGYDASAEPVGAAATREKRQSGQSDYAHHPSEELPAYGFGFDETKYADLHRDSKPRPDSIDVHGAAM